MAKDLLELYAIRESQQGYAFSKDTPWQREFEDLFPPYEETEGQIRSIEEIKKRIWKAQGPWTDYCVEMWDMGRQK